jgi:hypothetical protein
MSNIAGKAYAMNVVTPIKGWSTIINKIIFWFVTTEIGKYFLKGLITLSLIHYAKWAIIKPSQFPRLSKDQPKETIKYNYMIFFSNFNGSWAQYVDSFTSAIPSGLDMFWRKNVQYPGSYPMQPFHEYITFNQVWTNHYYNAYPMAAANDVIAAKKVKNNLRDFIVDSRVDSAESFKKKYDQLLLTLQGELSIMEPTPIVSLAAQEVHERYKALELEQAKKGLAAHSSEFVL